MTGLRRRVLTAGAGQLCLARAHFIPTACSAGSSRRRTSPAAARAGMPKQNPQAWGTLGGSCLVETRLPKARGDTSGDGDTRESNVEVSGAASRGATALWSNAIAPWYAARVAGQYVSVRQPFDCSSILSECHDISSISSCAVARRFPTQRAMNSPEIKRRGSTQA
jgi:hypothetical protein